MSFNRNGLLCCAVIGGSLAVLAGPAVAQNPSLLGYVTKLGVDVDIRSGGRIFELAQRQRAAAARKGGNANVLADVWARRSSVA